MTTPTPNKRDREVGINTIRARDPYGPIDFHAAGKAAEVIASYRQQIEAEKDKQWDSKYLNEALAAAKKMQALGERISTLEAALEKAEKALQDDELALDQWILTYASDLCDEGKVKEAWRHIMSNGGTLGYVTDKREQTTEALAAIREALSTSPIGPPQGAGVSGERNGNQP